MAGKIYQLKKIAHYDHGAKYTHFREYKVDFFNNKGIFFNFSLSLYYSKEKEQTRENFENVKMKTLLY